MISATNHVKTSITTDKSNYPSGFNLKQCHDNIFNGKDLNLNLMSTGQLYEDGTDKVIFDNKHCDAINKTTDKGVMRSQYNSSKHLYYMPVTFCSTNNCMHGFLYNDCCWMQSSSGPLWFLQQLYANSCMQCLQGTRCPSSTYMHVMVTPPSPSLLSLTLPKFSIFNKQLVSFTLCTRNLSLNAPCP